MAGRVLLDTNIVIAYFAGDTSVRSALAGADEVFVPSIAMGELYYGAIGSQRAEANIRRTDEFVPLASVLACDGDTAREYGEIKDALRRKGRPLPDNDLWIAAIARQHGLTLISRDGHFGEIAGLDHEVW